MLVKTKRSRVLTSLLIGFLASVMLVFAGASEIKELSFLFPEISLSPAVNIENEESDNDDEKVKVYDDDKIEIRFFLFDLFEGWFD